MKLMDIMRELVMARDALTTTWPKVGSPEYQHHVAAVGAIDALIGAAVGDKNERLQATVEQRRQHAIDRMQRKADKAVQKAERRAARVSQ